MTHVKGFLRVTAVIAAFLLVACGSADDRTSSDAAGASDQPSETSIVVGADGSSTVVDVPPGNAGETTTTGCPAGQECTGGEPPAVEGLDASGAPGSFAPAYLQASKSDEVVVELRAQSGANPQPSSISHLESVLSSVTGKNVSVVQGAGIDGGAKSWSADELRATGSGGAAQGGGRAVIHLLFVHGSFGGDESVLGIAVRGDTAAVFVDEVQASSTPLVGSSGIESAVVMHEVGHLLGLVDLLLHTGRQDPEHPGHSTNQSSVMYWAVESNLVAQLLGGGPPKDFDNADLGDLQTIRSSG